MGWWQLPHFNSFCLGHPGWSSATEVQALGRHGSTVPSCCINSTVCLCVCWPSDDVLLVAKVASTWLVWQRCVLQLQAFGGQAFTCCCECSCGDLRRSCGELSCQSPAECRLSADHQLGTACGCSIVIGMQCMSSARHGRAGVALGSGPGSCGFSEMHACLDAALSAAGDAPARLCRRCITHC